MTSSQVKSIIGALEGATRTEWSEIKRAVDLEYEKAANSCALTPKSCECATKNTVDGLRFSDNLDA
jgi:hypothetical protein